MRFENFNNQWDSRQFKDVFYFLTNNTLSRENLNYICGNHKNIHYGDILTKYNTLKDINDNDVPFINVDTAVKGEPLHSNDVIMADTAEDFLVGRAIEIFNAESQIIYSGLHTIPLRPKMKFASGFLALNINSLSFRKRVHPLIQGIKVYSLSKSSLLKCNLCFPEYNEQLKISNFLLHLENRIATQKKIIEDLFLQKNSIINTIFDNSSYNCKLNDIISQVSVRNKDSDIDNVLSVSNKYGFIKQSEQFEDREVASDDITNYKIVEKDVFAYNPARINVGSIAKYSLEKKGIISPMYICFKVNPKLNPEYLNYYFLSSSFKKQMVKRLEGSVRQCLTYESLANIPFFLPSIEVQKKNATVLAAFNNKINLERNYLSLLEKQKSYLLNKMFI